MKRSDKIIMFPNLAEKLLQKGMAALESKDYHHALSNFKQVIEIEQENAEAYFGLVVAYMELGHTHEAVEVSHTMLMMGIGDYFEILNIHVTMLIQLSRFKQAREMLEAIFLEQKVPSKHVEPLYRLLHISRQMTGDDAEATNEIVALDLQLMNQFFKGSTSERLQAFQQLSKQINKQEVLSSFLRYLKEENNPFIQTMVIQLLIELKFEQKVTIQKFNETMEVTPANVVDFFAWELPQQFAQLIEERVSHDNPTLSDYMKQLSWQYFFMIFPFPSANEDISVLLAGFEFVASERIGLELDECELAKKYDVPIHAMFEVIERIENVELQGFEGFEKWKN